MKKALLISFVAAFTFLFLGATEPQKKNESKVSECPYINKMHEDVKKGECPYSGKSMKENNNQTEKKSQECPYKGKSKSQVEKTKNSSKRLIVI